MGSMRSFARVILHLLVEVISYLYVYAAVRLLPNPDANTDDGKVDLIAKNR